jgi:hypothetical protein
VCDCSDQAAHYHNLGPQLGASLLTRHIGWKQKERKERKEKAKNDNEKTEKARSKEETRMKKETEKKVKNK